MLEENPPEGKKPCNEVLDAMKTETSEPKKDYSLPICKVKNPAPKI